MLKASGPTAKPNAAGERILPRRFLPATFRLVGSKAVCNPGINGILLVFHFHHAVCQKLGTLFVCIHLHRHQRGVFILVGDVSVIAPIFPLEILLPNHAFDFLDAVIAGLGVIILALPQDGGILQMVPGIGVEIGFHCIGGKHGVV